MFEGLLCVLLGFFPSFFCSYCALQDLGQRDCLEWLLFLVGENFLLASLALLCFGFLVFELNYLIHKSLAKEHWAKVATDE